MLQPNHFGATRQTTSAVRKTAPRNAARPKRQEHAAFNKAYDYNGEPERRESEPEMRHNRHILDTSGRGTWQILSLRERFRDSPAFTDYAVLQLQEFPYMRHQFDHFDRLLKEIVTSGLKTFGFQMWEHTHRNNRDIVCFRPLA